MRDVFTPGQWSACRCRNVYISAPCNHAPDPPSSVYCIIVTIWHHLLKTLYMRRCLVDNYREWACMCRCNWLVYNNYDLERNMWQWQWSRSWIWCSAHHDSSGHWTLLFHDHNDNCMITYNIKQIPEPSPIYCLCLNTVSQIKCV